MFGLFTTEPITIYRTEVSYDDLGEPVGAKTTTETLGVLVCPGATSDLDETRPYGVTVAYTLHFPKTYTQPLKDCLIDVRGVEYKVIGDPKPYTPENTPGAFNLTVEVTRTDG